MPVMTVEAFKSMFLQGIPLEDKKGRPIAPTVLEAALAAEQKRFSSVYSLLFEPTTIILGNVPEANIPAEPAERRTSNPPDYEPDGFVGDRWNILKLRFRPLKEIFFVGLGFGQAAQPVLLNFPSDWWSINDKGNILRLYPAYQSLALANLHGFQYSLIAQSRRIPNAWRICYRAGYDDVQGEAPDVYWALGASVAVRLYPILAQLRAGNIASESVSVDGLSQSRSMPVSAQSHIYSPFQSALEKQLEAFHEEYYQTLKGPRLFSA